MLPRNGTPARAATRAPSPSPKTPHMFSTTPSTGTSSVPNICAAFPASAPASRCGCVTTTAPESSTDCARLSGTSPVPGGRSTKRTSSSGQRTPRANCLTAFETMGPRHIAGDPSPRKKPKLMSGIPCASSGMISFSGVILTSPARSSTPRRIGRLGP